MKLNIKIIALAVVAAYIGSRYLASRLSGTGFTEELTKPMKVA